MPHSEWQNDDNLAWKRGGNVVGFREETQTHSAAGSSNEWVQEPIASWLPHRNQGYVIFSHLLLPKLTLQILLLFDKSSEKEDQYFFLRCLYTDSHGRCFRRKIHHLLSHWWLDATVRGLKGSENYCSQTSEQCSEHWIEDIKEVLFNTRFFWREHKYCFILLLVDTLLYCSPCLAWNI